MSDDIAIERTAKKRHTCAQCLKPIEPGQRYIDSRLPPGSELGYTRWLHAAFHLTRDHLPKTVIT